MSLSSESGHHSQHLQHVWSKFLTQESLNAGPSARKISDCMTTSKIKQHQNNSKGKQVKFRLLTWEQAPSLIYIVCLPFPIGLSHCMMVTVFFQGIHFFSLAFLVLYLRGLRGPFSRQDRVAGSFPERHLAPQAKGKAARQR